MFNRLRFTPARPVCSRATRADQVFPDVADGAVGSFIADGADGGQHATQPAQGKSRRWRDGGSESDKAVTRPYRVTARFSTRHGSRLQAASRRAAVCWPAQWRSGGGLEGTAAIEDTKASARFLALWRGSGCEAAATARGLRGYQQDP